MNLFFGHLRPPMAACLLLLVAAGGCMQSRALEPDRIGAEYRPGANIWPRVDRDMFTVDGRQVPVRFTLIRESSILASVVDLVELQEQSITEAGDLDLLIAPELADALAGVMRDAADATESWAGRAEAYRRPSGAEQWASDTAEVLTLIYRLERGEAAADPREDESQSYAAAVAPIVRTIVARVRMHTEGRMPEGDGLESLGRVRAIPVEFALIGAFRLAGLRVPPGAVEAVLEVYRDGPPTALGVHGVLKERLLDLRREARELDSPAASEKVVEFLEAVPDILRNLARLVEQWDKCYLASIEVGEAASGDVVSGVLDVRPGRAVRLDRIHPMAPVLTVEGRVRANFYDVDVPDGSEMHVQFVDERGGRAAVRFESWVYGLASLFTFPIEDWVCDEVVVRQTRPERHRQETDIRIYLRTRLYERGEDRRRVMHIHRTRTLDVTVRGERVERRVRHDTRFEFYAPQRMWYYTRTSHEDLPKPPKPE